MKFHIIIKYISFLLIINLFFFFSANANSRENNSSKNSLVALPYAFYSPETKTAIGVGSIYSFRSKESHKDSRPSSLKIAATYTQRKQFIFAFIPELYLKNENYFFQGFYTFYKYPDKYWGIGNHTLDQAEEDYEPNYLRTFTNIEKKIFPGLYIGIRYQYEYIKLTKTDENGILQYKTVAGSEGGSASGLGIILNFDTRDNIFYPNHGYYAQIYGTYFTDFFLSDYKFNLYNIDLRYYFSVFKSSVIAIQNLNMFISGEPPFQMMALLGGSYWMRGYYFGRYRDKNMITLQSEYRFPLFWRFGGVGFLNFGDVSSKPSKFQFEEFKISYGFGLRFMFDTKERINARLDIGFDNNSKSNIYALVLEAY